jgi:ketosteroid isomerase-like protein
MPELGTTALHPVFVRQLDSLANRDIDGLVDNYTPDATLIRFDGVATGIDEVRDALTGYLSVRPELVELTDYVDSGDTIFYRARMTLNGQPENAFGTLVIRDDKIWRQTAGFGN